MRAACGATMIAIRTEKGIAYPQLLVLSARAEAFPQGPAATDENPDVTHPALLYSVPIANHRPTLLKTANSHAPMIPITGGSSTPGIKRAKVNGQPSSGAS